MSNLRVLISTKIFPNAAHPGWAPFNRQQFAALSRLPGVEVVDVLATLPWFPGADLPILRGRSLAQGLGAVPDHEVIDGLPVRHPRTLYVPKLDGGLSGALHLASLAPVAGGRAGMRRSVRHFFAPVNCLLRESPFLRFVGEAARLHRRWEDARAAASHTGRTDVRPGPAHTKDASANGSGRAQG